MTRAGGPAAYPGRIMSTSSQPPLLAGAPKRWQRLFPYAVVIGLTALFVPVTIASMTDQYGLGGGPAGALAVAQAAPLLMLAHRPLRAWWIIFPADIVGALVLLGQPAEKYDVWPWTPTVLIAHLFVLLALALREGRRTLVMV